MIRARQGSPKAKAGRRKVVAAAAAEERDLTPRELSKVRLLGAAACFAAIEIGVVSFDASLGGLGGCPFAPNATGNIVTEDLAYMLHRMGVDTGLDLDMLAATAEWTKQHLPDSVVGLYHRAGPFP